MSDGDDGDDPTTSFASPDDRANEARDSCLDALSRIDPDDPNTSKIEDMDSEQQAIKTWSKHAAKAVEDGLPVAIVEGHAGAVAKESQHFTKKNLVDLMDDQRQQVRQQGASGSFGSVPPVDEWVENELERVIRLETTDATQDTLFRWDFSEGTIETGTTKDGITHFSWSHFRDEIYQGLGINTTKPNRREAEEWRQWLADLIEDRGETRTTFGPRSTAVEQLQEYVRDSVAYGTKKDAFERGSVYVDDDPQTGSPDKICINNSDIKRICDDAEIEVRALQQELDARGYTHDDVTGVSEGEYIDGTNMRYWVLTPDFATPPTWIEEADDAADALLDEDNDAPDGPDAGVPASRAGQGDDGGAHLTSIGPGDDDDAQSAHDRADDAHDGADTDPDAGGEGE